MKKCAALLVGAALLSGCRFDPTINTASGVYGPPQTEEVQVTTTVIEGTETTEPETEETAETTSGDEFDPADNQNGEVYGPPPSEFVEEEDIPDTDEESNEKPE